MGIAGRINTDRGASRQDSRMAEMSRKAGGKFSPTMWPNNSSKLSLLEGRVSKNRRTKKKKNIEKSKKYRKNKLNTHRVRIVKFLSCRIFCCRFFFSFLRLPRFRLLLLKQTPNTTIHFVFCFDLACK
jgi:hypothetical protein